MRNFYDQLDGEAVRQLLAEKEAESERLEFKDFGWFSQANYKDQIHKLIARPLCALANTRGGVVVYGLKTERRDGVDCAAGLNLCSDPKKFHATVNDLAAVSVQPPLIGVEVQLLQVPGESGLAAKVWVPESELKPHMVESKDPRARGHWYRNQEGCSRMGQGLIESAYRTRLLRELNSFPLVSPMGGRSEPLVVRGSHVQLLISNKGNAPAIGISIGLESGDGIEPTPYNCGIEVGALGPGEVLRLEQNLQPAETKAIEAFLACRSPRRMVVAFRDLTGVSYEVRLPLEAVAMGLPSGNELCFQGVVTVSRDGRNL